MLIHSDCFVFTDTTEINTGDMRKFNFRERTYMTYKLLVVGHSVSITFRVNPFDNILMLLESTLILAYIFYD